MKFYDESKKLYQILKEKPFMIAGPCVIESEELVMEIAEKCKKYSEENGFFYIFKASFDKANRTSASSYRGGGIEEGLKILKKVKDKYKLPITTDIHESYQAAIVGEVVDILQIPAFLCRQTDLLNAAADTGRIVNIKKAQFLSAADMKHPVDKVVKRGNSCVMLTERGTMFGYNNLVVDFRNVVDMKEYGIPVVMDITHSGQRPGGLDGKSGGDSKYAPYFAAMAAAIGVDGFFVETHPNPECALSDGPNMVKLADFSSLLKTIRYHKKF